MERIRAKALRTRASPFEESRRKPKRGYLLANGANQRSYMPLRARIDRMWLCLPVCVGISLWSMAKKQSDAFLLGGPPEKEGAQLQLTIGRIDVFEVPCPWFCCKGNEVAVSRPCLSLLEITSFCVVLVACCWHPPWAVKILWCRL